MAIKVIYHSNCADGSTAAAVVCSALRFNPDDYYGKGAIELIPAQYGDAPPEFSEDDFVYIVDFSYSKEILQSIQDKVQFLRVFDHHKTAQENCAGLPFCTFDMNHSGAMLVYKYLETKLHGTEARTVCEYVEDRDLWRWQLPDTREFSAGFRELIEDIDAIELLMECNTGIEIEDVIERGVQILKVQDELATSMAEKAILRDIMVEGRVYPAAITLAPVLQSEVGEKLYTQDPSRVALCIMQTSDGMLRCSLRSNQNGGPNVREIAQAFGGGGHDHAAGFSVGSFAEFNRLLGVEL